ncbi:MAG: UDP-N-acetylmuramoyl-tripeptide--D-alanyl-D-alanine ligase [Candidatus Taylorbacteria bacterium]|nr:UDP-N-acetylmuramoyl-tripeptide--D-alanyl-D-alanine ligase [Candidatus Taylorbacteria bacterium]
MRNLIKKIIVWQLDLLAKIYLWRFEPEIIAVTGNVGKTSTKEAISVVLGKIKRVRSGKGNLNNEFGVPLTIIGDWADDYYEAGNSFWFWCKVLVVSCWSLAINGVRPLLFGKRGLTPYPEVLVLEYGADRPGDIGRLTRKYKPKIGVVTAVGEIPVHVEYFQDPDNLAREKSKLISGLKLGDHAILNHDDPAVYEMKEKTKAKVMSYGFTPHLKAESINTVKDSRSLNAELTEGPTVMLSNFDFRLDENQKPDGVGFKIHYGANSFVPVTLHGVLGKSQALAAGAATCVGIIYGMNLIEISQALTEYKGPKGRLIILDGIKGSLIIDDTYNAAPSSTHLALETLRELPGRRKIAVLGDMLELGKYTIEAHEEMGNFAGSISDILVTVGARAKFSAYAAENQMPKEHIFSFVNSDLAKAKVQELIKEGDLILVKGSQGMRMEKIVEEIIAEPEKKKELLVRQGKKWSNK